MATNRVQNIIQSYSSNPTSIPSERHDRINWITNIDWSDAGNRAAYINRYFLRYVIFIKSHINNHFEVPQNSTTLIFADIGCGPGTASIALLDLICENSIFPNVTRVEIELVDHKISAIKLAERLITRFQGTYLPNIALKITRNSTLLDQESPRLQIQPELILCANMLCELTQKIYRERLKRFFHTSPAFLFVSDCVDFDAFVTFCDSLSLTSRRHRVVENNILIHFRYFFRERIGSSSPPMPHGSTP